MTRKSAKSSPGRGQRLATLGRQRRKVHRRRKFPSRRRFLLQGSGMLVGGLGLLAWLRQDDVFTLESPFSVPVRPPTASHRDREFQAKCVRCGLCGTVCENGCIRFFGLDEPRHGALTPYLDVRRRSCTLCMRCTDICPTGALTKVEDDFAVIEKRVDMGVAVVERDACLSYLGRVCGYCHDACPLPGTAISLTPPARPVVHEACVGCGRCVEFCPQNPTAISIRPAGSRDEGSVNAGAPAGRGA
ncbi:MAG: 4Fe-4S dicluster domain-containing protein [Myxococcales bacterium FL481]|nr:MAG: 4Fe-4S dicluster domain-containing protein [Myxococcales bacterium FL481]